MVPIIAAAAVGAVVWVGYSSFKKHMAELQEKERRAAEEAKVVPNLEKDPETGRYRPKD